MDATQIILRDHREVERLFKELERGERRRDADRERDAVRRLVRELAVHASVEEQLVYPALRRAGADAQVLDALEEHHAVKLTLDELQRLPESSERFGAKVRVLAESVRRHVEEEERELLPLLERSLDASARRELGDALERAKRAAPTRPHPFAPDTPPGNFVVGAFAAVLDRSRDAVRDALAVLRTIAAHGAATALAAITDLAARTQRWGRGALDEAVEQGRAAVEGAAQRGREVVEETRATAGRLELRGTQAAREVSRTGRAAAGATRKGARTAARDYRANAPRRGGARKRGRR